MHQNATTSMSCTETRIPHACMHAPRPHLRSFASPSTLLAGLCSLGSAYLYINTQTHMHVHNKHQDQVSMLFS